MWWIDCAFSWKLSHLLRVFSVFSLAVYRNKMKIWPLYPSLFMNGLSIHILHTLFCLISHIQSIYQTGIEEWRQRLLWIITSMRYARVTVTVYVKISAYMAKMTRLYTVHITQWSIIITINSKIYVIYCIVYALCGMKLVYQFCLCAGLVG